MNFRIDFQLGEWEIGYSTRITSAWGWCINAFSDGFGYPTGSLFFGKAWLVITRPTTPIC